MEKNDLAWLDDRLLQLIQAVEKQTEATWEVHRQLDKLDGVARENTLSLMASDVESLRSLTELQS